MFDKNHQWFKTFLSFSVLLFRDTIMFIDEGYNVFFSVFPPPSVKCVWRQDTVIVQKSWRIWFPYYEFDDILIQKWNQKHPPIFQNQKEKATIDEMRGGSSILTEHLQVFLFLCLHETLSSLEFHLDCFSRCHCPIYLNFIDQIYTWVSVCLLTAAITVNATDMMVMLEYTVHFLVSVCITFGLMSHPLWD